MIFEGANKGSFWQLEEICFPPLFAVVRFAVDGLQLVDHLQFLIWKEPYVLQTKPVVSVPFLGHKVNKSNIMSLEPSNLFSMFSYVSAFVTYLGHILSIIFILLGKHQIKNEKLMQCLSKLLSLCQTYEASPCALQGMWLGSIPVPLCHWLCIPVTAEASLVDLLATVQIFHPTSGVRLNSSSSEL